MNWLSRLTRRAKVSPDILTNDIAATLASSASSATPRIVPDGRIPIPASIKDQVLAVQSGTELTLYVTVGYESGPPFRSLRKQLGRSRQWALAPTQLVPQGELADLAERFRDADPAAPTRAQLEAAEFVRRAVTTGATDVQLRQHQAYAGYRFSIDGEYTGNLHSLSKDELRNMNQSLFGMADKGSIDGFYSDNCEGGAAIVKNLKKFGIDDVCSAIRLQFAPTAHGPECSIRLQSALQIALALDELGLADYTIQLLRDLTDHESGALIFCGPTGHGKTGLLAALINDYFTRYPERRGITIEDPVEIILHDAVSQWQLTAQDSGSRAEDIGKHIRMALRSHPQLLMLGELRDYESAHNFLQACLTGIVGLSTIHATTPLDIVSRLRAWGIDNYLLTNPAALIGLVAVRLPKILCPHCRIPLRDALSGLGERTAQIDRAHVALAGFAAHAYPLRGRSAPTLATAYVRRLDGCEHCRKGKRANKPSYGDAGRTLITEVLHPDEQVLQFMAAGQFTAAEHYTRTRLGVPTLREDAIDRVAAGQICILDAYRTTGQFSRHRIRSTEPGDPAPVLRAIG